MKVDDVLLKNTDCVDGTTLNRCFSKIFEYTKGIVGRYVDDTSENVPQYPFFKDGYLEYPLSQSASSNPEMLKYGLLPSTNDTYGLIERMYGGAPDVETYASTCAVTESVTGAYSYEPSHIISSFVPSVSSLFSNSYPIIFASLLGSETAVKFSSGTSTLDAEYFPTVNYTSYLLCSGIGISFGTIDFDGGYGLQQNNSLVIDVVKDLVHLQSVKSVEFVSIGNGMRSGVREISEDLDMVEEMCSAKITYLDKKRMRIAVTDIAKNDNGAIRIDKATGRILSEGETADFGTYVELTNDSFSLGFFVMFKYEPPTVGFTNASKSLGVYSDRSDYSYFMADVKMLNKVKLTLDDFAILDNEYLGTRQNTVTNASHSFYGCTNATFAKLNQISSGLMYADSCFEGCIGADFSSLVELYAYSMLDCHRMFAGCNASKFSALNSINLPSVNDASEMFSDCTDATFGVLRSIITCGNSDRMFAGCRSANFSNVTVIRGNIASAANMFADCDSAQFVTLGTVETNYIGNADFSGMFTGCRRGVFNSLKAIKPGASYISNSMFDGCSSANFVSLSSIGNTKSAKRMFAGCRASSFRSLSSLGDGNLADAGYMFDGCAFSNMALTGASVSSIEAADRMFAGCGSVTIHENAAFSSLKNAEEMFAGCNAVSISSDFENLAYADGMFRGCGNVTVNASFPSLTSCTAMLSGASVVAVDGTFAALTGGTAMFARCCSVDISEDTDFPSLTDGSSMFKGTCSVVVRNGFDDIAIGVSMFEGCSSVGLTSELGELSNGDRMFYGCSAISLSSGELSSLTSADSMFSGCSSVGIRGSLSAVVDADSMFDGCGTVSITGSFGRSATDASKTFRECRSVSIGALDSCDETTDYSYAFFHAGNVSVGSCSDSFLPSIRNGRCMFYDSDVVRFGALTGNNLEFTNLEDGWLMFARNDRVGFESVTSISITVPDGAKSANYYGMFSNLDMPSSLSSLESVSISSAASNSASANLSLMFSNEDSRDSYTRLQKLRSVTIRTAGKVDVRGMFRGTDNAFSNGGLESFSCRHSDPNHRESQTGFARMLFAGCRKMKFTPRELFLPVAEGEFCDIECYHELFYGVDFRGIDLSQLTPSTTNIHRLGYRGRPTDARGLFRGILGVGIHSPHDALRVLGLRFDIGSSMDWGFRHHPFVPFYHAPHINMHHILTGGRPYDPNMFLYSPHSPLDIWRVRPHWGGPPVNAVRMSYPKTMATSAYFDGDDNRCRIDVMNDMLRPGEGIDVRCRLLYHDDIRGRWMPAGPSGLVALHHFGEPHMHGYLDLGFAVSGRKYCVIYETDEYSPGVKGDAYVTMTKSTGSVAEYDDIPMDAEGNCC